MASSASEPAGHAEGAPKHIVVLREHDPAWLPAGARLVARLRPLLGDRALAVEHIGSTAVPGLLAKPIIDIAVGVAVGVSAIAGDFVTVMESDGWIYRGARPDEDGGTLFVAETAPLHRVAHVHVVRHNGSAWVRYLGFRDALRGDPELREAYGRLKRGLAAMHPRDRAAYTEGKTGFVLGSTGVA
jgi:GrpB-like predicted nucleotidyltransferase (UPF0157 family)